MKSLPHPVAASILLLASLTPVGSLAEPDVAAQGWTLRQKSDQEETAYSLYVRPRAGSDYAEYRMEVPFDEKPEDVLAAIEHNMLDPDALPANYERRVLRREGSAIVTHDYIRVRFLADRDVILRTEIDRDPASGFHVVRWFSIEGEGPPPTRSVVRMPSSRGSWTLVPRDTGTLAVYEAHIELGGFLPSAFVESNMPKEIVQQARTLHRTMRERRLANR
jgi:hypothetical protein